MPELKAFDDSFGPGVCRTCGAKIWWAELVSGKRHPFNAEPSGERPLYLRTEVDLAHHGSRLVAHIDAAESHFVSCPQGKDWKRKK